MRVALVTLQRQVVGRRVSTTSSPRVFSSLVSHGSLGSGSSAAATIHKDKKNSTSSTLTTSPISLLNSSSYTRSLSSSPLLVSPPSFHDKKHKNSQGGRRLPPPLDAQIMFKSTAAPTSSSTASRQEEDNKTALVQEAEIVQETKSVGGATPGAAAATTVAPPTDSWVKSLDFGIPALVPEWKRMFRAETLFTDVSAGLTVGCIAVPLSLAIAVASGVPPEVGLVTAAVSGVAGAMLGGTNLAVTGPAAAISLLIVDAVQQHGLEALPFITLMCGGLQVASGVTKMGVYGKLVPVSVIAGFTTGVGTLILTGQLPKALGMHAPAGLNPVEVLGFIGTHLPEISPAAASLAIGTSAAMFLLPKVHAKMPAALLAVGGATVATHTLGLDVSLIGEIPTGLAAFSFGMPIMPSLDAWPSLAATTLLIYGMTSVESLLSCAALDKMKKQTTYRYNPDQELVGQGMANAASALFMGMPVTSVIARSGLNVRCGAETRLPAIIQAGFVFSSVVFMSSTISLIPMPALSGMLITTGMAMLTPAEFKHCYKVQKLDAVPFATTVAGMISFGLAEGIGIGCLSAIALHYGPYQTTMGTKTSRLQIQQPEDADNNNTALYQLHGPVNFLSMFEIDRMMKGLESRQLQAPADQIVLDMQGVTALEFTGVEEMVVRVLEASHGTPVQMINCNPALMDALNQCDPKQEIERKLGEVAEEKDEDNTKVTF